MCMAKLARLYSIRRRRFRLWIRKKYGTVSAFKRILIIVSIWQIIYTACRSGTWTRFAFRDTINRFFRPRFLIKLCSAGAAQSTGCSNTALSILSQNPTLTFFTMLPAYMKTLHFFSKTVFYIGLRRRCHAILIHTVNH